MQIVNINLVPSGVNPIVYASQHDNGRVVRFHLMNNSSEWILDPSDTVRADITRPDGTEISIPMTNNATPYSDLTISYDDLDQEGVYVGEVVITDQYDNVTGSLNFILKAEADPYGDDVTTETAVGNPCTFDTDISDTLVSLKAAILASGGGGTPSTPIPIVGHSELWLQNTHNQNLFGGNFDELTRCYIPAGTVVCASTEAVEPYANVRYYDKDGNVIDYWAISMLYDGGRRKYRQFTILSDAYFFKFDTATATQMQIEIGSTPTPYVAYNGTPYLVSFGQTVYGGVYDANRGKVRITHSIVDLGSLPWYNGSTDTANVYRKVANFSDTIILSSVSTVPDILCTNYSPVTPLNIYNKVEGISLNANSPQVIIYDANYNTDSDMTAFLEYINGVKLVYPLATPIEIDVSALSVDTIVGVNNIVSDCNGDVEVTYIKKV